MGKLKYSRLIEKMLNMEKIIKCVFGCLFVLCTMLSIGSCSSDGDDDDGPVVNSDILTVESGMITIHGDALTGTIKITANCHWVIQKQAGADGDWLTVNPSEGTGDAVITVTANSVNPSSTDSRKITLILKSDGGISRSITVTQTIASETLTVSPETLTFDYQASTKEFTVTSNASWSISGKQDWFTLSSYAGKGSQTIQVAVQENPSEVDARTPATLVITTVSGESRRYLSINQDAHSTSLSISTQAISATAKSASYTLQLTGDASWTATSNQSWAKLDQISGKGGATLKITCDDNIGQATRTAIISINSARNNYSVSVTQAAGTVPTVSAIQVTNRTKEGVTLNSSFTSDFPVSKCGFCYGTTPNPTIDDKNLEQDAQGAKSGTFTQPLTNLEAGTTYYARAYAISAVGVAYSENMSFTTTAQIPGEDDNNMPNPAKRR